MINVTASEFIFDNDFPEESQKRRIHDGNKYYSSKTDVLMFKVDAAGKMFLLVELNEMVALKGLVLVLLRDSVRLSCILPMKC